MSKNALLFADDNHNVSHSFKDLVIQTNTAMWFDEAKMVTSMLLIDCYVHIMIVLLSNTKVRKTLLEIRSRDSIQKIWYVVKPGVVYIFH